MKYLISLPLFFLITLSVFTWSSCDKQTCENVVCNGNNTVCQNGQCVCANGFEGPNCDTYSFEKFIGNYQVSENCQNTLQGTTNGFYNMFISVGGNINTVVINNFLGFGTVEATIIGNEIFISSQSIGATTTQGYGEFFVNQRQIRLEYSYTRGSEYAECTAIMTKL